MKFAIDQVVDLQGSKELQQYQLNFAKRELFCKIADEIPAMNGPYRLTLSKTVEGLDGVGAERVTFVAEVVSFEEPWLRSRYNFDQIKRSCKYHKPAFVTNGNLIDTCLFQDHVPGISWAYCSYASCPLLKTEN